MEMKPCPFCGESEFLKPVDYNGRYSVECEHCSAGGPMERTEEEAVAKWNERREAKNA